MDSHAKRGKRLSFIDSSPPPYLKPESSDLVNNVEAELWFSMRSFLLDDSCSTVYFTHAYYSDLTNSRILILLPS